jgi:NAD(P)-dependent dehydrogenase (short-subunit alcohol dehydrogenase family)
MEAIMILKDKVAIVTGAKQGIGLGIAVEMAKEGANVVVSDLDQASCDKVAEEINKLGVKAIGVKCDVSNKAEVDNLIAKTKAEFGKIDILVNNAGIYPFKPFLEMTEEEWDKVININLKSVFLCSQAAAKEMASGGKIVNTSSVAAFIGFAGLAHYCASKGGINAMIRALALELANKNITVNAIAPGAIDTPGASAGSNEEVKKQTIANISLARMGKPEDIANLAVFLASEKANYITGQTIIVDGGWTLR